MGNETELALQMVLKAKPGMRPLQTGPVIFTNGDLIMLPLALADTSFSSWYRFLSQNCSTCGGSCEVLGCCFPLDMQILFFFFRVFSAFINVELSDFSIYIM